MVNKFGFSKKNKSAQVVCYRNHKDICIRVIIWFKVVSLLYNLNLIVLVNLICQCAVVEGDKNLRIEKQFIVGDV